MALMDEQELKEFHKELELKGEKRVSQELAMGVYGAITNLRGKAPLVRDWLDQKEQSRKEEKRDQEIDIAKETNEIAREANRIAKSARDVSWWAIVVAIISLIISAIISIWK